MLGLESLRGASPNASVSEDDLKKSKAYSKRRRETMEPLRWKARIAVLWVISAEAFSAHMIMVTIDPVSMKKMLEWGAKIDAGGWVFATVWWLIAFWMAFVTLTAKGSSNRWANFVVGIIATLLNLYHFFMCAVPWVTPVLYSEPTAHTILLLGTAVVATALIIWYAWKWPKQDEGVVDRSGRTRKRGRIPGSAL
jgi:hypothetical protein